MPNTIIQASIPRGLSNITARVLEQSPGVGVSRSPILEKGDEGFTQAIEDARAKKLVPYIKEHAAFLSEEAVHPLIGQATFVVPLRDPSLQIASEVMTTMRDRDILRKKLGERRGEDTTDAETEHFLHHYAAERGFTVESDEHNSAWEFLVQTVRDTGDFTPLYGMFDPDEEEGILSQEQSRSQYDSDVEWFDHNAFAVGEASWTHAAQLVRDVVPQSDLIVVDTAMLQTDPTLSKTMCQRAGIAWNPSMTEGGWGKAGSGFSSQAPQAGRDIWVGAARNSTSIKPPHTAPITH